MDNMSPLSGKWHGQVHTLEGKCFPLTVVMNVDDSGRVSGEFWADADTSPQPLSGMWDQETLRLTGGGAYNATFAGQVTSVPAPVNLVVTGIAYLDGTPFGAVSLMMVPMEEKLAAWNGNG